VVLRSPDGVSKFDACRPGKLQAQSRQQILRVYRLGQNFKFVTLGTGFFEQVGGCGLSGKQQDFASWQDGADLNRGVDTIHVIHNDIADNHLWPEGLREFNSRFPAIRGAGFKTVSIQNNDQRIGNDTFVVNHQYLWLHKNLSLRAIEGWSIFFNL